MSQIASYLFPLHFPLLQKVKLRLQNITPFSSYQVTGNQGVKVIDRRDGMNLSLEYPFIIATIRALCNHVPETIAINLDTPQPP